MDSLGITDEFEEFKRRASTGGLIPYKPPLIVNVATDGGDDTQQTLTLTTPGAEYTRGRARSAGVIPFPLPEAQGDNKGTDKSPSPIADKSPDTLDPLQSLEQFRIRTDSAGSASLRAFRSGDHSPGDDSYLTLSSDEGGDCSVGDDVPKIRLKRPSVPINAPQSSQGQGQMSSKQLLPGTQEEQSCDFLGVDPQPMRRKSDLDRSDTWDVGSMRPRTSSMPGPADLRRAAWARRRSRTPSFTCPCGCHLRKVRSFTITHKGEVQHEGDVFVTKSNPSLSSLDKLYWCPGGHLSATNSLCTSQGTSAESLDSEEGGPDEKYLILIMGKTCVGKTSIIHSFIAETTIGNVSVGEYYSFTYTKTALINILRWSLKAFPGCLDSYDLSECHCLYGLGRH